MAVDVETPPREVKNPDGPPAVAELGLLPTFESGIARAAALAGAVGGTVGLLYVIGGCVMWLRFDKVGIPADQAVALMPKVDLLIIGLRVMVLPALASGLLLLWLVSQWVRRRSRIEQLRAQAESADEMCAIEADLARERQAPASPVRDALPDRTWLSWVLVVAALAAALAVPASLGALAWPFCMAAVVWYWLHLRAESIRSPSTRFPVWRVAAVAVAASAVISIARQSDPPVQLPVVQVTVTDASKIPPNVFVDSRRLSDAATTVTGVMVAMTADEIAVGDPTTHAIASIPRDAASAVAVGPSVDRSSPPQSLLSKFLIGRTAWAVTPLEFWCGNERYGWTRIYKLCTGRPSVAFDGTSAVSEPSGLVGLRVNCPSDAPDACHGYLQVTTKLPFPSVDRRLTTPLAMPPAAFTVAKDSIGDVKVSVDQQTLWDQVDTGDHSGPAGVAVDLRISLDADGKTVVYKGDGWMTVTHPPGRGSATRKPPGGGAAPTPTPVPTATPTADASSPLQPQEPSQLVPAATPTP